ncbi:flippase [Natronococcus sp.]|uniref:flippase n=1 Tax=Natronococcus sp. TaxID=35747 RepID=UPI003A4D42B7
MKVETDIISGFKFELAFQVLKTLLGGLLIIVLARLLTAGQYGLLHLTVYLCSIVVLFSSLGIPRSIAKFITEYDKKDPGQIPHIITTGVVVNTITVTVSVTVLVVFREEIAQIFDEPGLELLIFIGVLYIIFESTMELSRRALQAFRQVSKGSTLIGINTIFKFGFAVVFVLLGYEVIGAFAGYVAGLAAASLVGIVLLYSVLREYTAEPIEAGLRRRILEYSLPLTVTDSGDILMKRVDILLIGFFLTPVAVGYYTIGKQIVSFATDASKALGFSISPHYSEQYTAGNTEKAAQLYKQAIESVLVFYIPAMVGLIVVAGPTVRHLVGSEYMGAVPVIQVLAVYMFWSATTNVTGSGLDYLGKAKFRATLKGTMAVANAILGVLLIPQIGVLGAAIPTVITYGTYAVGNVYVMSRLLSIPLPELLGVTTRIVPLALLMGAVVYGLSTMVSGVGTLLVTVALGVSIYGGLGIYTDVIDTAQVKKIAGNG